MHELFEIADEVSVYRDGWYISTHASTGVTRDDIIQMMVGRELTHMFPKEDVPIGDVVLSVKGLTLDGVFSDVTFDVRAGEILGIAGLVGSGRSNVAETLFGVTPASSGTMEIDGRLESGLQGGHQCSLSQALGAGSSSIPRLAMKRATVM